MSRVMRKWAFGHTQTAKLQASLRIRAVSPKLCCLPKVISRPTVCNSNHQSFCRDCVDAQARLKLCCLHMSEGPFSHDATQMTSSVRAVLHLSSNRCSDFYMLHLKSLQSKCKYKQINERAALKYK